MIHTCARAHTYTHIKGDQHRGLYKLKGLQVCFLFVCMDSCIHSFTKHIPIAS